MAVSGIPAPAGAHRLATGGAQQGTQRRRSEGWVRRAPLLPALVFTIIVTQLPFLFTLYYSLQSWNLVRPGSREFVGLSNYANVFTDSTFREAALNTVIITGSVVLIAMVIGVALALLLDRKFLGRGIVRTLLITPFLVTPVAAALLWKTTMFDPVYGIINFVLSPFGVGDVDWVSRFPLPTVITELVWQWTPFMMLLGIALALLLDRKFLGRGIVRTLLITPFLVTPVAAALLWKTTMFDPVYGIINFVLSPLGVGEIDWISRYPLPTVITELVWQWTPFMMLLVLAGLQSQPREVVEAARVDGASSMRLFRELTLPHLRRYIELGLVLGAIYVVNTFDAIYMMTQGGPGTASTNLPFYLYQRAFLGFDIGQAAALGVVVVAGTIIVSTIALRLIFTSFSGAEEGA